MIRPTGHRVLIQPDEQPEQSGDILLPQHLEFVSTSGTVIAIGPRGSRIRWEARQRAIREVVELLREQGGVSSLWQNELLMLIGSPDPEHEIRVGDRVAFDSESGLRLFQDGIEYLILDEDDVVVIVNEQESAA